MTNLARSHKFSYQCETSKMNLNSELSPSFLDLLNQLRYINSLRQGFLQLSSDRHKYRHIDTTEIIYYVALRVVRYVNTATVK